MADNNSSPGLGAHLGGPLYPAYGARLGSAAIGLNVVGKINDGININQHLIAERYREAGENRVLTSLF